MLHRLLCWLGWHSWRTLCYDSERGVVETCGRCGADRIAYRPR
jgi:hypothetical protein